MLDYARAGDTVVVTAIDRLGRSVAEVTRTIADLGERRILLRALREGIDTATPTGRAVAAIMATLAELELELGRERRAASREARRTRQLPATKPPKLTADRQDQLRRLAATGEPVQNWPLPSGLGGRPHTVIYPANLPTPRSISRDDHHLHRQRPRPHPGVGLECDTGPALPRHLPPRRFFLLGSLMEALALAGTYMAGDQRMDTWMPSLHRGVRLHGFANTRGFCALPQTTSRDGSHGFSGEDADTDPNSGLRQRRRRRASGAAFCAQRLVYQHFDRCIRGHTTDVQSHGRFLETGLPKRKKCRTPGPGWYRSYFNGTPHGRIAFHHFGQLFQDFLSAVWSQPNWKFRPPQSLR